MPKGTGLGHGIFAVRVKLDGKGIEAPPISARGRRSMTASRCSRCSRDFDEKIYGHEIEVSFVEKVRSDRKFATSEAVVRQMEADCAKARQILAAENRRPRAGLEDGDARRSGLARLPPFLAGLRGLARPIRQRRRHVLLALRSREPRFHAQDALAGVPSLVDELTCPSMHIVLQSGSNQVLKE